MNYVLMLHDGMLMPLKTKAKMIVLLMEWKIVRGGQNVEIPWGYVS